MKSKICSYNFKRTSVDKFSSVSLIRYITAVMRDAMVVQLYNPLRNPTIFCLRNLENNRVNHQLPSHKGQRRINCNKQKVPAVQALSIPCRVAKEDNIVMFWSYLCDEILKCDPNLN